MLSSGRPVPARAGREDHGEEEQGGCSYSVPEPSIRQCSPQDWGGQEVVARIAGAASARSQKHPDHDERERDRRSGAGEEVAEGDRQVVPLPESVGVDRPRRERRRSRQ